MRAVLLLLALCVTAGTAGAGDERSATASERIESLCHSWTESRCILKVSGSLRSARSGGPLEGKRLRFVAGGTPICSATTDETGRASCYGVVPSGRLVAESGYRIVFEGEGRFLAGSAVGASSVARVAAGAAR